MSDTLRPRMRPRIAAAVMGALLSCATPGRASEPITVEGGIGVNRIAWESWKQAETQIEKGEMENARRNVEIALRADATFWPALYTRAKLFAAQGRWELVIQDCGQLLHLHPAFPEAALLRAEANNGLGQYAACLKEMNYVVSITRPRLDTYARALNDRAWFYTTCAEPSFRNAPQAIKDASMACKLFSWKDSDKIDTLAAAYAEAGDFDSAVRYEERTMTAEKVSSAETRRYQEHLALFKQHRALRPVRSASRRAFKK